MLTPLDLDEFAALVETIRATGRHAVAVSFLHSYQNPEHEREGLQRASGERARIVLFHFIRRRTEIREYERTTTTVANVYVRPLAERYTRD